MILLRSCSRTWPGCWSSACSRQAGRSASAPGSAAGRGHRPALIQARMSLSSHSRTRARRTAGSRKPGAGIAGQLASVRRRACRRILLFPLAQWLQNLNRGIPVLLTGAATPPAPMVTGPPPRTLERFSALPVMRQFLIVVIILAVLWAAMPDIRDWVSGPLSEISAVSATPRNPAISWRSQPTHLGSTSTCRSRRRLRCRCTGFARVF